MDITRCYGYLIKGSLRTGYQVLNDGTVLGVGSTLSEAVSIAWRYSYGL